MADFQPPAGDVASTAELSPSSAGNGGVMAPAVVERNVHALEKIRAGYLERRTLQQRVVDRITAFAGSVWCVYVHLGLFGSWLLFNSGVLPVAEPFDPYPFVMLAMFASVEAIFLSTFVLISQNRMAALSEKRNDLDLQVNLLAEHEITRLLQLVDEIAKKLDIPRDARRTEPLKADVQPEAVMERMERVAEQARERAAR
ncbi:MAG: hypothetical protein JWN48_572 [Myxococcaceae bacterium]|nr:hypothetical protein [Myxococcaceae bacterium]